MTETKQTFCRICEPCCPLIAESDDEGNVIRLCPNTNHPSGGNACHKGLSFLDVHRDPDRLNHPLKRTNPRSEAEGQFVDASWQSALSDIGERLKSLRDRYGPNSIAVYYGNPYGMSNPTNVPMIETFLNSIGTQMVFNPGTQDCSNKFAGARKIYGSTGSLMIPDLENTDYVLCLGANPRVSRWTIMSVPNDDIAVLKRIRKRGGKVLFVNPRRTESSTDETGPTLLIKPGADVYFLAALLLEMDRLGSFGAATITTYGKRVEELRAFISLYPAEKVAGIVGISVDRIKEIALEFTTARSAVAYLSTGVNQGRQGTLAFWLVEMINFLTGNLGRVGGSFKPTGLVDVYPPAAPSKEVKTSVGTFEMTDTMGYSLPGALLSRMMKNGDFRALIVLGGNPVLTVGGEESFRDAVSNLDLLVSFDIYRHATGELADYVLPATDWLEHMDINFVGTGLQVFPNVQYTDAVVAPKAERRNAWWVLSAILQAMKLPSPLDKDPAADDCYDIANGLLSLRGLSIENLRNLPYQTAVFPQTPRDSLYIGCLAHPDKKIDCCPPDFESSGLFDRCARIFDELCREADGVLKMISLRTPYMQNSFLGNLDRFRRGKQADNALNMTELDAAARGLHEGDRVRVYNGYGSIETRISIVDDLRHGVVALSHGYGFQKSFGVQVARRKPGANYNAIAPIGPDTVEPISYMSWISGIPVEVEQLVVS